MLTVYKNIKKYRLAKKMTQTELAEALGYADKTAISKIEKGVNDLTVPKIIAFAKVLGVEPGDLMGNDGCIEETMPEILSIYNELNEQGKEKLMEYAHDLLLTGRYKSRNRGSQMVERQAR